MIRTIWRYGVRTFGVKKRARKADLHFSGKGELGHTDQESPDWNDARKYAHKWLDANMKSYEPEKTKVTATLWKLEGEVETWEMFNSDHNKSIPLSE